MLDELIIRCTFCGHRYGQQSKMTFTEEIRLLRHYKKAHQTKPEHYKQKWYWDN